MIRSLPRLYYTASAWLLALALLVAGSWTNFACAAQTTTCTTETKTTQTQVSLHRLSGRWFVLDGNYTSADLDRLGITSRHVRKNNAASERGKSTASGGLLLYQAEKLTDPFSDNYGDTNNDSIQDLTVSYASDFITVHSQCLPNHPHATFPNINNPNTILVQNFTFKIPVTPTVAANPIAVPMGPIGVALNGVVLYNQFSANNVDATKGANEEWFDSCCGHPDQSGIYHYHKYPRCVKSPFVDKGDGHSPLIGYAWDGYAVYGPYESNGVLAMDLTGSNKLDLCNGHTDGIRGYHYHVSPGKAPYILGGYHGIPEHSNNNTINNNTLAVAATQATGTDRFSGTVLTSFSPATLSAGHTYTVQLGLTTTGATPPVPSGNPTAVQVGPYTGTSISRVGDTISASITISSDASLNVFDVHVEFPAPSGGPNTLPVVYRKSDAVIVLSQVSNAAGVQWRLY